MGIRLLLVSSEIQTWRIFEEAAPGIGAEVIALETVEEAGRQIRDEKYDAIFIDATLPNLSRLGFTRLVRKSRFNSRAPIVWLTQLPRERVVAKQTSGDVSSMRKPSSPADLTPYFKDLRRKLAERRKGRRLSFRTSVNCFAGVRRFQATSVNLSATGLLLGVSLPLECGDQFEVQLLLSPGAPVFRARVRVARIDAPKRVGVNFLNLGSMDRRRLRLFLDQHLPVSR